MSDSFDYLLEKYNRQSEELKKANELIELLTTWKAKSIMDYNKSILEN